MVQIEHYQTPEEPSPEGLHMRTYYGLEALTSGCMRSHSPRQSSLACLLRALAERCPSWADPAEGMA